MQYAAHAAHFLATTGTSGAAMDKMWKWGAMSCRLTCTMTVNYEDTTMIRSRAENQLARDIVVICENRFSQATLAKTR